MLPLVSVVRVVATNRKGGSSGGRSSSPRRSRLSASAHCRSSITTTSGRRSASRPNSSRSAAKSRPRSSCGSTCASTKVRGARATALTWRSTGKTSPSSAAPRGSRTAASASSRAPQVAGQRVDHAVEGLVGHRLALVAAPRQHHRAHPLALELGGELAHQRDLAHARLAAHQHGRRPPAARGLEGVEQREQLGRAADERRGGAPRRVRRDRDRRRTGPRPRRRSTSAPRGPRLGIGAQELHAELGEVARRVGDHVGRRHRRERLLGRDDLQRLARERHVAGERLVEHHAHAVPVGRRPDGLPRGLLGRHVVDRAEDVEHPRLLLRRRLGHQARSRGAPPALRRDQHVGGLDVAVHLAGLVQRVQPVGELAQRGAQPLLVARPRGLEARPRPRRHLRVALGRSARGGGRRPRRGRPAPAELRHGRT